MNLNSKFKLVIIFLLALNNGAFAQQLSLKIIQGSIVINKEVFDTPMIVVPIWPNAEVKINEQSIVLVRKDNSCVEITAGKYNYKNIENRIKKESSSFSSAFVNVIFNEKFQELNQQKSGVTTRGTAAKAANYYSPLDDFKLIDNSLNLEIGNSTTVLLGEVFVCNKSKNDTILKDASKRIKLQNLPKGSYVWGYTISYNQGTSKVKEEYLNTFIVPEKSIIEKEKVALADFKESIKEFSVETQDELLKEYYQQHKIIAPDEN